MMPAALSLPSQCFPGHAKEKGEEEETGGFDNLQIIKAKGKDPIIVIFLKCASFKEANKILSRQFNITIIIAFIYYILKSELKHYFEISKL